MIAGGGSIQNMINTLRNNKNLLRKKSMFKKERSFLQIKKEYLKVTKGKIELKNTTKEELALIRQRVLNQRQKERGISLLIAVCVLGFFTYLAIAIFKSTPNPSIRIEIQKQNNFLFFITDGDNWFEKEKWHNAVFQYQKALEIYPNDFDASYRLALAYVYHCKFENKDCNRGKILLMRLLKVKPENSALIELNQIFKELP
jgi:tetratricopeptide (TPR) repeat protein